MTSARRIAANRANAARSTGPRSATGRARAAANSRKHGATAALDTGEVRAWFRLILEDPTAEPDLLKSDPRRRAAHHLAQAEVRLTRARRAEEAELAARLAREAAQERGESRFDRETVRAPWRDPRLLASTVPALRTEAAERARATRLCARYRTEAESARRKALRRWIEAEGAARRPISRNEPKTADAAERVADA